VLFRSNLKTFATLSPIPGFSRWLEERMADGEAELLTGPGRKALSGFSDAETDGALLKDLTSRAGWNEQEDLVVALKDPLHRLAARYLAKEKGRNDRARDPVAHFHLSNGARMEQLNWMGDLSDRGLKQSYGMMINYLYRLGDIETNSAAYLTDRKIAQSAAVRSLAKGG